MYFMCHLKVWACCQLFPMLLLLNDDPHGMKFYTGTSALGQQNKGLFIFHGHQSPPLPYL